MLEEMLPGCGGGAMGRGPRGPGGLDRRGGVRRTSGRLAVRGLSLLSDPRWSRRASPALEFFDSERGPPRSSAI